MDERDEFEELRDPVPDLKRMESKGDDYEDDDVVESEPDEISLDEAIDEENEADYDDEEERDQW